jgi:hypothetical protein
MADDMHSLVDSMCSFSAAPISPIRVLEVGPLKQIRIRSWVKKSLNEERLRLVVRELSMGFLLILRLASKADEGC